MADDFSNLRNYLKPPVRQDESRTQKEQSEKPKIRPRVCFIITQKKNSSWVDDLCNCELITPDDRVYH